MTLRDDAERVIHDSRKEEWLSVKEYAFARRVHVQTVYAAIRRGLFPHPFERVGRTIRVYVSRESIQGRIAS